MYCVDAVKRLRKFENVGFKTRKNEAELDFLQMCHHNELTLNFLNFKLQLFTKYLRQTLVFM